MMEKILGLGSRNPKPETRNMKGQAAIEYLMTYGWAILVIAIVIVALYVMTQTQVKLEQCTFPPGFMCNDPTPQIYNSDGKVYMNFKMHNKQAQAIEVSSVHCTTDSPSDANVSYATSVTATTIPAGSSATFSNVVCKRGNSAMTLSKGQDFRGYLIVWYNYENDINTSIKKTAVGSVSSTVQQG